MRVGERTGSQPADLSRHSIYGIKIPYSARPCPFRSSSFGKPRGGADRRTQRRDSTTLPGAPPAVLVHRNEHNEGHNGHDGTEPRRRRRARPSPARTQLGRRPDMTSALAPHEDILAPAPSCPLCILRVRCDEPRLSKAMTLCLQSGDL